MRRIGRTRYGHATFPESVSPGRRRAGRELFRDRNRQPRRARMDAPPAGARAVGGVPARRGHGRPYRRHVDFVRRISTGVGTTSRSRAAAPRSTRPGTFRGRVPTDDPSVNFHVAAQAIAYVRSLLSYIAGAENRRCSSAYRLVHTWQRRLPQSNRDARRRHRRCPRRRYRRPDAHPRTVALLPPPSSVRGLLHDRATTRGRHVLRSPCRLVPNPKTRSIWAGRADRLVRPREARRLIADWGEPEACWYTGGHMGFLGPFRPAPRLPRLRRRRYRRRPLRAA